MREAIKKLPEHLQKKIHLLQEDLTGTLSSISKKIEDLSPDLSEDRYSDEIAKIIHTSIEEGEKVLINKKYDFVVSSMLTSQLFSQIHQYIFDILENRFSNIKEKPLNSNNVSHAVGCLIKYVCVEHLDNLFAWTSPTGKIYYADTTHAEYIRLRTTVLEENNKIAFVPEIVETFKTLPNEEINHVIEEKFLSLKSVQNWVWQVSLPIMTPEPFPRCISYGNNMQAAAHYLQPKVLSEPNLG
jgi:hypothetical protein